MQLWICHTESPRSNVSLACVLLLTAPLDTGMLGCAAVLPTRETHKQVTHFVTRLLVQPVYNEEPGTLLYLELLGQLLS